MAHRLCIVWLTRSCSPCGTLARLLADANAVDIVVSAHKFARVEALLSWGRASPPAYCPNMKIQFVDNTFTEGNHMWNWNATYPYPHPKTAEPYLIGVLGSDQDVQPCMPYPHGACDSSKPNPSRPAPYQGPINHLVVIKRNSILYGTAATFGGSFPSPFGGGGGAGGSAPTRTVYHALQSAYACIGCWLVF